MKRISCFAALLAAVVAVQSVNSADDDAKKKEKKFTAKCPVSGKAAKEDSFVEYRKAKVFLCCAGCPDAFKADTEKYSTAANQQLLVTRQFRQKACPLSGGKLNKETAVKIGGVRVQFCCNNCKGKVEDAEGDDQLALVFANKAFEKAFVKRTPKKKGADKAEKSKS